MPDENGRTCVDCIDIALKGLKKHSSAKEIYEFLRQEEIKWWKGPFSLRKPKNAIATISHNLQFNNSYKRYVYGKYGFVKDNCSSDSYTLDNIHASEDFKLFLESIYKSFESKVVSRERAYSILCKPSKKIDAKDVSPIQEPEAFSKRYLIEPIFNKIGFYYDYQIGLTFPNLNAKKPDYGIEMNRSKNDIFIAEAKPIREFTDDDYKQIDTYLHAKGFHIHGGILTNGLYWEFYNVAETGSKNAVEKGVRIDLSKPFLRFYNREPLEEKELRIIANFENCLKEIKKVCDETS